MKKKNQTSSVLGVPEVASEKGGSSRGNSVSPSRSESPSKSKMAGSDESRSTKRVDRVLEPKLDVPQAQRGRGSPAAAKPATAVWMHQNHKKRLEKEAEAARQSMAVEQEEQEEGSRAAAQSIDDGSGVQPMDQDLPPMDSPPPQEDEEMQMEEEIEVAAEKKVQEQEPEPQVENRAPPSRQPGTKPATAKSTSAQASKPASYASREESDAMDVEGEEEKEEEEVPIARKTRAHRAVAVEKQALQTESTPIRAKASNSKSQGSGKMKAAPSVSKHQASSPTAPGSIPTDSEPHDSLSAQLRMNIDNNNKNNEAEKKKKAHKSPVEKEVIYQAPPGQVAIPEGEYQRYLEYRSKKQSPAQKAATVVEEEKENENGKDGEDVEMAIMEDDGDTTFVDMEIDPKPSQSQGLRRKGKIDTESKFFSTFRCSVSLISSFHLFLFIFSHLSRTSRFDQIQLNRNQICSFSSQVHRRKKEQGEDAKLSNCWSLDSSLYFSEYFQCKKNRKKRTHRLKGCWSHHRQFFSCKTIGHQGALQELGLE